MNRSLDVLQTDFKTKIFELLARCTEQGIYIKIVSTLRTPEEHAENLKKGVSWVKHSKHLDGKAIDVCPILTYSGTEGTVLNWDARNPQWEQIGKIAESLGLIWGGRWKVRDMGHIQDAS